MNKTLRIVAKDARHLWPEILASLALTAGFVATDRFAWPQHMNQAFHEAGTLRVWMQILMPLSWWLLLSRAVHDESLVGDRQFWITRPYGWPRVLAAKLIFIAAFILAPYFLAQCLLLREAGLHPLYVLPGLAFTLLAVFLGFLLPLIALATVTATITRIFIIFFGLAIYAGVATYTGYLFKQTTPWAPGSDPYYFDLAVCFAVIISAAVTLLQYSRRRTKLSIALLLVLVAIVTAGVFANNYGGHHVEDFPAVATGEPAPLNISLNPDSKYQYPLPDSPFLQTAIDVAPDSTVEIPVTFSGIQPGHAIRVDAEKVTVSADGQKTRDLYWERRQLVYHNDDSSDRWLYPAALLRSDSREGAYIPGWVYREFRGKKVTLHLTYAIDEFVPESAINVAYDGHAADVPDNGHCTQNHDTVSGTGDGILCQYALTGPSLTLVTWKLYSSCDSLSSASMDNQQWIGDPDPGLRELDPSPIYGLRSYFTTNNSPYDDDRRHYGFCPGTNLTFTKYHLLRRRMVEATLPPLDPRLYIPPPTPRTSFPATILPPPAARASRLPGERVRRPLPGRRHRRHSRPGHGSRRQPR